MATYSIRDLEKLTGIKAHTIRVWEQRYNLITPMRTETNIRYYTDENLKLLNNIALLYRHGLKISKLAQMSPDDIEAKGAQICRKKNNTNSHIEAITLAALDMDEKAFEDVFFKYVSEHGFEDTMMHLLYPFLDKLRVLWLTSNINLAQEKFICQLIRQKLMCYIDQLPRVAMKSSQENILLFSPEGAVQDFSLLFLQYLIRSRQIQSIYLGSSLVISDLAAAVELLKPDYVMTVIEDPIPRQSVQAYIDEMAACVGDSKMLLTGSQVFVGPLNLPSNAKTFNGMQETIDFLDMLPFQRK
ncbi:MAG: MerR family transcriptional regulator [Saprospiraceae bacterium]